MSSQSSLCKADKIKVLLYSELVTYIQYRVRVYCTGYLYPVLHTCTQYCILVSSTAYLYTVMVTCILYWLLLYCTGYLYSVYRLLVYCTGNLYTVLVTYIQYWLLVYCRSVHCSVVDPLSITVNCMALPVRFHKRQKPLVIKETTYITTKRNLSIRNWIYARMHFIIYKFYLFFLGDVL